MGSVSSGVESHYSDESDEDNNGGPDIDAIAQVYLTFLKNPDSINSIYDLLFFRSSLAIQLFRQPLRQLHVWNEKHPTSILNFDVLLYIFELLSYKTFGFDFESS